jgi:hypothetical protein
MLRGTQYAGTENYWYQSHLNALKSRGIMNYTDAPMIRELRGNVFIMLHRLYDKGYVKAEHGASSTIDDFVKNTTARTTGYAETSARATTGTTQEYFTLRAPTSVQKGSPIDFMISATKGTGTNTAYTGGVLVTITGLDTKDYTIMSGGQYTFTSTDKGRKVFAKGITINKAGIYTIQARNIDATIFGERKITVLET